MERFPKSCKWLTRRANPLPKDLKIVFVGLFYGPTDQTKGIRIFKSAYDMSRSMIKALPSRYHWPIA